MKQLIWALAALAALIWGWKEYFREIPYLEQPGVLKNFHVEAHREFLGRFTVAAQRFYAPHSRALYKASAWVGEFNDLAYLSNVDVLLAQGALANPQHLKQVDFDQHSRCYTFTLQPNSSLTADDVRADSVNISAVASNEHIAKQLRRLKAGQRIELQGQYAEVTQLKTRKFFVTGMSIAPPRPHCAIVKITFIQILK